VVDARRMTYRDDDTTSALAETQRDLDDARAEVGRLVLENRALEAALGEARATIAALSPVRERGHVMSASELARLARTGVGSIPDRPRVVTVRIALRALGGLAAIIVLLCLMRACMYHG
jgi:hypothetical protein